jgi:glucose-1-phosphate thymidylyltransferase
MKAIILAGGLGTRLYPLTLAVSKQLLPVYDKPMIYYPIATLLEAGVTELLLITTSRDQPSFKRVLQAGEQWGVTITYCVQDTPRGIAEALLLGKDFVGTSAFCLMLGDNFFVSESLSDKINHALTTSTPTLFAAQVNSPNRYGVAKFDRTHKLIEIIEKPMSPPSAWAITGLYCFDHRAVAWAEELTPSARGELEITDINNRYCQTHDLQLVLLDSAAVWFDMGTHDDLLEAATFVQSIERRKGIKIADLDKFLIDKDK